MLSWLLNGPLSLLFVLSGIVLNALCVLISLACWHSALLCNAFVLYCLPTLLWGSVISTGPYVHLYPPTYMLANATHTGTVWIVLALTLDRYLALCLLTFILTLRITIALGEAQRSRKRLSSHCEQQLLRCSSTNNNSNNEYKNIKNCYNAENSEYGGKEEEKSTNILFNEKQQHKMMLLGGQKNGNIYKKNNSIRGKEHRANVLIVVIIVKFLISDILPTVLDVFETFIGNEAFMSSPMATLCVDFSNIGLHIRDSSSISPKPIPHSNRFNSINGCSLNTNKIINGNLNLSIEKQKQINLLKRRACSLAIEQQNNNNKISTNLSILPQQQQNNIYLSQQPLAIISQQI
uniref:G protein-coupled receptor n=1 Tax=Meloidogyne javanica TaxID=6303 RepID=A0A915MUE3_MELJA